MKTRIGVSRIRRRLFDLINFRFTKSLSRIKFRQIDILCNEVFDNEPKIAEGVIKAAFLNIEEQNIVKNFGLGNHIKL